MGTEWMGRYRPLVHALVQHANVTSRNSGTRKDFYPGSGVYICSLEWQLLEYLVEHNDDNYNMIEVAESLGIAPSSLSKYSANLGKQGLVDRYRLKGNNKNIILKPTQKGLDFYTEVSKADVSLIFQDLFQSLDDIPDDMLDKVVSAISKHTVNYYRKKEKAELEKINVDN